VTGNTIGMQKNIGSGISIKLKRKIVDSKEASPPKRVL